MNVKGMHIEDDSGDRKYFTMLPNYILNHSTANDQALYMQMKRYAGEKGECFASEAKLMQQLGIGRMGLKKSLDYLLKRGWIQQIGFKSVETKGGIQKIKVYSIVDIWEMNAKHFQGVVKTAPLKDKGVVETTRRGVQNDIQGVVETASKKNYLQRTIEEEEAYSKLSEDMRNILKGKKI